jgi:hypothetical protein
MNSSISEVENRLVECHTGSLPAVNLAPRDQRMAPSIVPVETSSAMSSLPGTSRPVTRRVDDLRPHSGFVRHKLAPSIDKLSALATRGEAAFQEPLIITQNGTILDGHARWELARRQGRRTLDCLEREMTDEDALLHLLQNHRGSAGLNHFTRILLALDLEPWFKMQARSNQQRGGLMKGSSNLTQAERLDVRAKIASAAGVSLGNVTKVKQLLLDPHLSILEALRSGEIRIHRAWRWSAHKPDEQCALLERFRSGKRMKATIHSLLSRHKPQPNSPLIGLRKIRAGLSALKADERLSDLDQLLEALVREVDHRLSENSTGCHDD